MNTSRFLRSALFTGMALALFVSPVAKAASINGSFPLSGFTVTKNGADLVASTTVSLGSTLTSSAGLGDFSPIPSMSSFGPATLNLSSLVALAAGFSLNNATYGSFVASSAIIIQQSANFLDIYFVGMFTPAAGLPGLDPSAASARISVNENGGSLSAGITLNSPPAGVPEPATFSVVAGGLALLGLAGYRRRAAK